MSGVAERSGPPGNQNAKRGREWRNAIDRALEKRGNGDRTAALDALAERFLDAVEEMTVSNEKRGPSIAGFSELGNRLDGHPAQAVQLSGDPDGEPIRTQVVVNFPKEKLGD